MKILIVHNSYQQPGGEDTVVAEERRLLRQNGHTVRTYSRSNDEINNLSLGQQLRLISRIVSAADTKIAVRTILHEFKPDVVHVHNTFAMVSPSVYEVCHDEGVPVVQTLHNYRLLCPAATLYRDGSPCEECVTHSLLRSVRHACYRDSRLMSGAIALMLQSHRRQRTWDAKINAYIAISSFVRDKFVAAGFSPQKITVKPNFVDPDPGEREHPGNYALFVGRLSPEKGLTTLLAAWASLPKSIPLLIAGDGPIRQSLENEVSLKALRQVHFVGRLNRNDTFNAIKKAAFLVVPSVWNEPFGMVIAEAFACGTPVLGASTGSIREMVDDQVTGIRFGPRDPDALAETVAWAWGHLPALAIMGKAARKIYEDRYSAKTNYEQLMTTYRCAIDDHATLASNRPRRSAA